jgi:Mg2+ and Co2+ transporter CorA
MASNTKKILGNVRASDAAELAAAAGADAPGVDKIRELLFGNQMQDYDRRFAVMEDHFAQKLRDLEGETARSLTGYETSLKKQLESIVAQARNDKDVLGEADKTLERSLRENIASLEKRLSQTADHLGKIEREFMERLERSTQQLRDEIRKRGEDTHATMQRMFSELSNVKTDRNLLAGLFVEIARVLNQEPAAKGSSAKGGNADSR